LTKRIIRSSSV